MALRVQMLPTAVIAALPSPSISRKMRSLKSWQGGQMKNLSCRRQRAGAVRASGMPEPEYAGGSGIVDSNMMVLRKRIQSIRIQEACYEPPADWMEWERSAYSSYRADVCLLLSNIQSQLLMLRPGTVLSIVSVLLAVLPVMSILFLSAVWTQLWTLHCALLDLASNLH